MEETDNQKLTEDTTPNVQKTRKKKVLWIVVACLLVAGGIAAFFLLHHKSSFKDNLKTAEETTTKAEKDEEDDTADRYFQIEEGGFYLVCLNQDTAFLLIDRVDDEEIAGSYYPVKDGSDEAATHKFSLEAHRKTLNLLIDKAEYIFGMKADKLHDLLDEDTHKLEDEDGNQYQIALHPYREPEFHATASDRYRKEIYGVSEQHDITYGKATGYWTSFVGSEAEGYANIVKEGIKNTLTTKDLDLKLDLYLPKDGGDSNRNGQPRRPLLLFLHGGAFYVGDKSDPAIADWCRHFAAMGYVAASINYRMGFVPSKKDIERTGYMATQDANAAMRYLVSKKDEYKIDTNRIFVAGTSAGAITALNVAFMKDRPSAASGKKSNAKKQTTRPKKGKRNGDLGGIQDNGNNLNASFHILAVANMWGAVNNLNMLKNSHAAIISFHGDADQLVPYDQGYPFADISERLGKRLFDQMYGSKSIDARAKELGLTSELYTFPNEGHALHLNPDRTRNYKNFSFIRDHMTSFFYRVMLPRSAKIEADPANSRHYRVEHPMLQYVDWKVQGGFILRRSDTDVWVVWRKDSDNRLISASGSYTNGIPFNDQLRP